MNVVNKLVGVVKGYRRSRARQYNSQVLLQVLADPKILGRLVGAKVVAKDVHGNVYRGKIVKVHSFRNCIAVTRFKPNIPGQLIGSHVEIILS
jgi:large subunit ribosomal protein L35Ae